ncbi:iron-siderophore ABC transporter substrate-binding protein [Oceanicella actignis]|uniref:Iron complex transport system substrate-binding protein n=1 Tax=Oceanicella actignis TaxID=1189325 RepID=A0A1M7SF49_9RHOB|nr:iron-siderophore ABC transporter substrate-binding protein [Oceanicella actignis]SET22757.1 iron complex transport system substrate-binding protein [Oceanicella actignis]SHN57115.1 iron complex transport system substrate-binding protein [Oceanicella actignis]
MLRSLRLVPFLLLGAPAAAQEFPVRIAHAFGTAEIPAPPSRVVSLSFIGHDFLLALGVKPYALRKWYGDHPHGVWPWAQEALGDAEPIVMQGEIDIEAIAAMRPDLIVGQWSGMTAYDHRLLSQIAPTIAHRAEWGPYGAPWQEMLRTLGMATGRLERAEAEIARLEARFARIRAAHPDWQGASAVMVWAGSVGAYTSRDIRGRLLRELGFVAPAAVEARGSLNRAYVRIPPEDLSAIDVDALIWLDSGASVERLRTLPLRRTMRAHAEGREIYSDLMLSAALSHSSPLSLDYALDRLTPLLEAAMDGDPATVVATSRQAGILGREATDAR